MNVLYVILPVALLLSGGAIAAFIWTVAGGQLDDVDSPPRRILFEGDGARSAPAPVVAPTPVATPAEPTLPT